MTALADVLDRLADDLDAEVDRLIRRDKATPTLVLVAMARTLRRVARGERIRSRRLPRIVVLSLAQWARAHGVSTATAKRRAARGLIAGAVRVCGMGWVVLTGAAGTTQPDENDEEQQG